MKIKTRFLHLLATFLVTLAAGFGPVQADDLDIYNNSIPPAPQAPLTVIALDLNLLNVGTVACTNILLPPPVPPLVPGAQDADCLGLQQLLTVGTLLDVVGALPGNLLGGVSSLLSTVLVLVPGLLNASVASVLQAPGLAGALLPTIASLLNSANLLTSLTGALPVYLALSNMLHPLINTRVGIMLNHGNQSASPPTPCAFADQSSLGGQRQDTTGCSNGGYFFLGLLDLTNVGELLAKLLPLLTGAVGNVLNLSGSGSVSPNLLAASPYQTKELYSEFMHYLTGGASYNAKLNANDNALTKTLVRDQTIETADHRNYVAALETYDKACTINLVHVQLTAATGQDDSDDDLLSLLPDARRGSDGKLSMATVVDSAANDGFLYKGSRRYINSLFLVQDLIGNLADLSAVKNLGGNVTTYSSVLGLIGQGQNIAGATKRVLKTDASLVSTSITTTRSNANGLGKGAYFAEFQPDAAQKPVWPGNLKRLQISAAGDGFSDKNGGPGIASDGRIRPSALTFWTDVSKLGGKSVDGRDTQLGGAGQKIPGYQFGGGGDPGRSNNPPGNTTPRTVFYDSYPSSGGPALAALKPDDAGVRTELLPATAATAYNSGTSACSTTCNSNASACSAACALTQTGCNSLCGTNQTACNGLCGTNQAACNVPCGTTQTACAATADTTQTTCNTTALTAKNLCTTTATTTQAACVAPATLTKTTCDTAAGAAQSLCNTNATTAKTSCDGLATTNQASCKTSADLTKTTCDGLAATNRTTCNASAATVKTACDLLCLTTACHNTCTTNYNNSISACTSTFNSASTTCTTNKTNSYSACDSTFTSASNTCTSNYNTTSTGCTSTFTSASTTCTNNYNTSVAPCTSAFNSSTTACNNTYSTSTAQCTTNHTNAINTCTSNNTACTGSCTSSYNSCGTACGTGFTSCGNTCTTNANSCTDGCNSTLSSCQSSCGVDNTRSADVVNKELLLYARGFDVGTLIAPKGTGTTAPTKTDSGIAARPWMLGAVLHSKPLAINYGKRGGGSEDIRIVYGSADGFMHMVNDDTGAETWAFMPQAVMNTLATQRDNTAGKPVVYGVDGAPVVIIRDRKGNNPNDANSAGDGILSKTGSSVYDRVYLYFGLRRGGAGYYGMDITDPDNPVLMWSIGPKGLNKAAGAAADSASNYSQMGLSFSTPQVGRMNVKSLDSDTITTKMVLIFGGGYNGGRDSSGAKLGKDLNTASNATTGAQLGQDDVSPDRGNALFIVDAETGELIWRATRGSYDSSDPFHSTTLSFTHPLLTDGIASEVTALDTNGDGLIDRLYVGDTGGRLWRADFPGADRHGWTATPVASVGRHNIADVADDRRFFHAPDYVPIRTHTKAYDIVLIASGNREDPLDTKGENWLYAYRDTDVLSGKAPAKILTSESAIAAAGQTHTAFLDETTSCATAGGTDCKDITELNPGWRMKLRTAGEKAFSSPLTLGGVVLLSTFLPPDATTADPCTPTEGGGRLYAISLRDSSPPKTRILQTTDDARSVRTAAPGLTGDVAAITANVMGVNAETLKVPGGGPRVTSWRERLGDDK